MSMSAPAMDGRYPSSATSKRVQASVAVLAFLGYLAIAQQTGGLEGNSCTFKVAFVCFGTG